MKKEIPIVYASDENFLCQTYVSIYSVLKNRKFDYRIRFLILVPEETKILSFDKCWTFKDYSIEYITVSSKFFKNVSIKLQNITKPTFFRLIIPLLMPEYDKCIYLDGDTICCKDILELYDIDLGNNYIAAVKGAIINFDEKNFAKILELQNAGNYINAGVLVMNLKLMRYDQIVDKFIEHSKRGYPCQDQDVINKCCYGKIKLLPLQYNVYCNVFVEPKEIARQRFEDDQIEAALSTPVIIHYPREYSKPWKNINAAEGKRWWDYAEQAIDGEVLHSFRESALHWLERYDYRQLYKKLGGAKQVVLFGFSELGCKLCEEIEKRYPDKIVAFCDNDSNKIGLEFDGYKVVDIEQLLQGFSNAFILITSQNYSDKIYQQLVETGFSQEQIAIYRKKTLDYMYSFSQQSFDSVLADILLDPISTRICLK